MRTNKIMWIASLMVACLAGAGVADNGWGLVGSYWSTSDGGGKFGPGTKLSIELMQNAQLDFRASYFDKFSISEGGYDADLTVVPLEMGLAYNAPLNKMLDLYAGIGVGYYLMDGDLYEPNGRKHDADPGNQIGYFASAALEYVLTKEVAAYGANRVSLLLEGQYRFVEADDMTVDGASYRIKNASLNGPGVNIGLMVRW